MRTTTMSISNFNKIAIILFGTGLLALLAPDNASGADKPRVLLLMAGRPSHGPMEHEFNAGVQLLQRCLKPVPGLELRTTLNGWPKDEKVFEGVDAILLFADGGNGHPFIQNKNLTVVDGLMKKGVGLLCAHFGVEIPKDRGGHEFMDWIGGYYEHLWSCNPHWTAEFKEFPNHPITRGVKPFAIRDEWYFNMRFRPEMKGVQPILLATPSDMVRKGPYAYPRGPYDHIVAASGRPEALMWAVERADGGRGVGFTGGHYHRNWADPNFRKVFLNALLWISKVEVPADGVTSEVTKEDLEMNLDPKPARKKN